MVKKKRLWRI